MMRHDVEKANVMIRILNKHFLALQSECIENDSISRQHLPQKGLHLTPKSKDRLALNFLKETLKS